MAKMKASSSGTTGKSKLVSTGKLSGANGGSTKMFGKQTVKASKAR